MAIMAEVYNDWDSMFAGTDASWTLIVMSLYRQGSESFGSCTLNKKCLHLSILFRENENLYSKMESIPQRSTYVFVRNLFLLSQRRSCWPGAPTRPHCMKIFLYMVTAKTSFVSLFNDALDRPWAVFLPRLRLE